jgi:hypothetical protein
MGDEVLKKIIFFALFVVLLSNSFVLASPLEDKIKEYDTLFNQIGKKRVGISNEKIDNVKNPFLMTNQKQTTPDGTVATVQANPYMLSAIFGKKAKINGLWYKINDTINDFKLVRISDKSVVIQNEHLEKEILIRKNDAIKIKFSSK